MSEKKYDIRATSQFKKDYKQAKKRGCDMTILSKIIDALAAGETLPAKNKDHALKGKWKKLRECHVLFDWLLVYQKKGDVLVLDLLRTGTHQDIFGDE